MLTIPGHEFVPYLPAGTVYIKGQREVGAGGFDHWQIVVNLRQPSRLAAVKRLFGDSTHAEPTKSDKALEYVWKEETRVANTSFELGTKPINRSEPKDWQAIRDAAVSGRLHDVPPDIFVRCYHQLSSIGKDNLQPLAIERECFVFWGKTGTGKSRRAWAEASLEAYPKDPRTKFWDGYREHANVVIDEFRGDIDIAHMLRWLDRYPVIVEVKGGSRVLRAERFWITSNLDPRAWYPSADEETKLALLRRLTITHFDRI